VDKKSREKELTKFEDTVKDLIGDISESDESRKNGADQELSSLENLVKGALTELTDLEGNLLNLIGPTSGAEQNYQDSNLFMAVRRFQNAMKVAVYDGTNKRDLSLFEEAFNFYNNALELITSTGDLGEIDQHKSEFAQALQKIANLGEQTNEEAISPFLIKAYQGLAEIYDSFEQYNTGLFYHGRAANLLIKDPQLIIHANFEYFQAILGYLLINENEKAQKLSSRLNAKHISLMANNLFPSLNEKKPEGINKIKGRVEALGAQRRINISNVRTLLDKVKQKLLGPMTPSAIETLEVPSDAMHLSSERMNAIKTSLSKGIQHLQEAHPNIQVPVAQIDTSSIVSELKEAISSEISKEIKSLSNDIVSKILGKLPTGSISSPALRSAGPISETDIPDIDVVAGGLAPGEKPKRPKLDDMLNSIIVSE